MRVFAIRSFVCGLVLLATGCGEGESETAHQGAAPAGAAVFPPAAHTWKDYEGRDVDLRDYRGKIVVLNFWAVRAVSRFPLLLICARYTTRSR